VIQKVLAHTNNLLQQILNDIYETLSKGTKLLGTNVKAAATIKWKK